MLLGILEITISILIVFFTIIIHECAHGWMAYKCGDSTAKRAGRLSLNPLKHIDPIGTLLVPGFLIYLRSKGVNTFVFGWAKPVPVNFMNLRNPKKDIFWVGAAGPGINIIIALICSAIAQMGVPPVIYEFLVLAVFVNLLLAIFNLLPIPPLDGSRLVIGLLPVHLARPYSRLEPYGILIVFVLLYLGLFEAVVLPLISLLGKMLNVPL